MLCIFYCFLVFFFKQKTAYEMRISDWSSDVCSSDLDTVDFNSGAASCKLTVDGSNSASEIYQPVLTVGRRYRLSLWAKVDDDSGEIGRASCRERVCQYV